MKESIGEKIENILYSIYKLVIDIDYEDLFEAIFAILTAVVMITSIIGSIPETISFIAELFALKAVEGAIGIVINLIIHLAVLAGALIVGSGILLLASSVLCFFATIPVFLVTILLAKIYELSYDFIEDYKRKKKIKKEEEAQKKEEAQKIEETKKKVETKKIEEIKKEEKKQEPIQSQGKENEEQKDEIAECINTISNALELLDEEEKNDIRQRADVLLQRYYNPEKTTDNDNKEIVLVLDPNDSSKKKIIQELIDLQKETLDLVNKHKEENESKYYYDYYTNILNGTSEEELLTNKSNNMSLKQTKR